MRDRRGTRATHTGDQRSSTLSKALKYTRTERRGEVEIELGEILHEVFDRAPHPYVLVGTTGRIHRANQHACALTGRSTEDLVGLHVLDLYADTPAGRARAEELFTGFAEGEWLIDEVLELRHAGGASVWVRTTRVPLHDEEGDFAGALASWVDVTDRLTPDQQGSGVTDEVRAAALGSVGSAVMVTDVHGTITWVNHAFVRVSGYAPEEVLGQTPRVLRSGEHTREHYEQLWATILAGRVWRGEMVDRRKDGSHYRVVQTITPILDEHGAVTRFVAVHDDVTEQRRTEARTRFQSQLLDAVGDAVIATDLEGKVQYVNPAAARIYGWSEEELLGRSIVDLTVPESLADHAEAIQERIRSGRTWTGQFEVRRRDGTTFPALVTNAPYRDARGEVAGMIGVSTDIASLERTRRLLTRRAEQQRAVAEVGQIATRLDDVAAVARVAKEKAQGLLGPGVQITLASELATARPGGATREVGEWLEASGPEAAALDVHDREFLTALSHIVDAVRQRREATAQLEHLATHDPLTGLPNRTLFLDRIEQVRAGCERTDAGFAVLFLDLDGLKAINDGLGHDAGDEVLTVVARRLERVVRPDDTVARLGGDEFAILCPGVITTVVARSIAERVRTAMAGALPTQRGSASITTSVGIAYGDKTTRGARLLRDADTAMYAAKSAGRNRVEVFDERMRQRAEHRFDMTAALRHALEHDGIEVHYQPTVALADERVCGVEALVRLRTAAGSLIPPGEFIWVAEETGLIDQLGQRVLERACHDAKPWLAADPDFLVSVNLSPRQLMHEEVTSTVEQALEATGLPPSALILELTESTLLATAGTAGAMNRLRARGVRFAIDDFGTGYSSLAHLRHMPVDPLKIDRSFVSGLHSDIQDQALVAATMDLAGTFGLLTNAEGVETPQQLAALAALGCDYAQGYLWSPAVPASSIHPLVGAVPARLR